MANVYGDSSIDDGRLALVALMNVLKAEMAGTDPVISNVYGRHNVADLRLNAVSVGFDGGETQPSSENGSLKNSLYLMTYSIRVHTDYAGGYLDDELVSQLLNSVLNKLLSNLRLSSSLVIQTAGSLSKEEFKESASLGGQLLVVVLSQVQHTQEAIP